VSSDPCEKISNYLNIWRIAVSSERPLPCPLKPREMQESQRRDAAVSRKVKLAPVKASSELNHPPRNHGCLLLPGLPGTNREASLRWSKPDNSVYRGNARKLSSFSNLGSISNLSSTQSNLSLSGEPRATGSAFELLKRTLPDPRDASSEEKERCCKTARIDAP